MKEPVVPRPAATLSILRESAEGFEVLMMQRSMKADFMPGAYVFPGGGIEREDADPALFERCSGLDDAAASRLLRVEQGGLCYWVGAIRECFEEAGLLLCYDRRGALVTLDTPELEQRYVEYRAALNHGKLGFLEFLQREDLRMAVDRLTYFSHWITPLAAPKRYDTRFFAALVPAGQQPLHDDRELVDMVWVRPSLALAQEREGKLSLRKPTLDTLTSFVDAADCSALLCKLEAGQPHIRPILPAVGADGSRVLPGEKGYTEASSNPTAKWT
jgi:8-oxo-dGTP pyrophosphatase MutT (NUDIX family)